MRRLLGFAVVFLTVCTQEPAVVPPAPVELVAPPAPLEAEVDPSTEEPLREVAVYYFHPHLEGMRLQTRYIFPHPNLAEQVKQVIDHLTIPPEQDQGSAIWPPDTYVREAYLLGDRTVVVDFDEGFLNRLSVGTVREEFMVCALVNSILQNFPDYDRVHILVQGTVRESLLGHVDIESALGLIHSSYIIPPEATPEEEVLVEDLKKRDNEDREPTKN